MIAIILIVGLVFLLAICSVVAYCLFYYILDRRATYQESMDSITKDPDEARRAAVMFSGTDEWKDEVHRISKEWYIDSFDGLKLFGLFLEKESHTYVILCHGLTSSYSGMLGRAEHYYRNGFNVLIPDARAHGKSEGLYRGMGFLEKDDLKRWIEKIVSLDPDARIVITGESMGASTVMMTAAEELPPQVKCVIEDCGYTSVWDIFTFQLKLRYHLPAFPFMNIASFLSKKKAGYDFKEASPLNMITDCHLPILMIHGTGDMVVPYQHMELLYERANEPKEFILVEGAGHCISMVRDTKLYWDTIDTFINKHM